MEEKNNNTIPTYSRTGDINNKQNEFIYAKLNGFTIYQFNNANANNYFLVVPDGYIDVYQLFVGFPQKDYKYSKKTDVIEDISSIKKMISEMNKNAMYVLPDIPLDQLEHASRENDNKKFSSILKNYVQPIISDVYLKLKDYDNADKTIDQMIYFVKQSESDTKFIQWLEINLPNFVHGISYDQIKKYYYSKVENEKGKDMDLDKTIVISKDQLFEKPAEVIEKENTKKRILVKPDVNKYGFVNMPILILILSSIILVEIIVANVIFK